MGRMRQRVIAARDQLPKPGRSRLRKRQFSTEPRKSANPNRRSGALNMVITRRLRSRKWPRERAYCCDSAGAEFKRLAISAPGETGGEAIARATDRMPTSKPRMARTVDEALPHLRSREPKGEDSSSASQLPIKSARAGSAGRT